MLRTLLLAFALVAAPAFAQTGGEIYKDRCALCHDGGATGAPRLGIATDWMPRVAKGRPALIHNAARAAPHAAGPTTGDLTAAVDYMLSSVDILVNSYSEPPRLESGR